MSTPPAPARVFGFVATEADVCVLLRRGPSRRVLMVRWDLATDEFEIGQWLKLAVFPERCDLSPDGLLFATNALDYRPNDPVGPYVAVSRPPFFTALALWRVFGAHTAGARWEGPRELWIDVPHEERPTIGQVPQGFAIRSFTFAEYDEGERERWKARAAQAGRSGLTFKGSGYRPYRLNGAPLRATWADVDRRGRLLFAREGRVFVRGADGERELIDLNPFEFRSLAPPDWATEWPSP